MHNANDGQPMSSRWDVLRSYVRKVGEHAQKRLHKAGPWSGARRAWSAIQRRQISITREQLTHAIAHVEGVHGASIRLVQGEMQVDATLATGQVLQFALIPHRARFAPRGAKEVSFVVAPPELSAKPVVQSITGHIGGRIAVSLWAFALTRPTESPGAALVDREGPDTLRADLRTVPVVRALMRRSNLSMLFEVLEIRTLSIQDDALHLDIRLPSIG